MAHLESPNSTECCMCGDSGFSFELFQCIVCKHRIQHRYCSNNYPKAESYKVCNWCLHGTKDKSQISSSSSTSHALNNNVENGHRKIERKNNRRRLVKRIITTGELKEKVRSTTRFQENMRRKGSEDVLQRDNGVTKRAFRKVKRYKFLDEVSS